MSKLRIFILSVLIVMSSVLVLQSASANTSVIDFETETERVVEDFTTVDDIRFESQREWQRVVLDDPAMFENLEGAVIADVSFSSTPLIMRLNAETASVVFYYGYGRFQTTTTLEVQGYLKNTLVFQQTFEPQPNTYGFYEGVAVIDAVVDMVVVRSRDARSLLAIDHIREFDTPLVSPTAKAAYLVSSNAPISEVVCLPDTILDAYRIVLDADGVNAAAAAQCQP